GHEIRALLQHELVGDPLGDQRPDAVVTERLGRAIGELVRVHHRLARVVRHQRQRHDQGADYHQGAGGYPSPPVTFRVRPAHRPTLTTPTGENPPRWPSRHTSRPFFAGSTPSTGSTSRPRSPSRTRTECSSRCARRPRARSSAKRACGASSPTRPTPSSSSRPRTRTCATWVASA